MGTHQDKQHSNNSHFFLSSGKYELLHLFKYLFFCLDLRNYFIWINNIKSIFSRSLSENIRVLFVILYVVLFHTCKKMKPFTPIGKIKALNDCTKFHQFSARKLFIYYLYNNYTTMLSVSCLYWCPCLCTQTISDTIVYNNVFLH